MEQHINTNLHRHEASPQQVYVIQLDSNIQIESQVIPLHIMENLQDFNGDFTLPLLQQKQGQPFQLLIEPPAEPAKVANKFHKTQNEIAQNAQISMVPAMSMDIVKREPTMNHTQDSALFHLLNIKSEQTNETIVKNVSSKAEVNKARSSKQKIKNYVHIPDVKAPPRAIAVLPATLQMRGKWISPRRALSSRVRFGPVQGIRRTITKAEAHKLLSNAITPIFLLYHDVDSVIYIDVADKDKSNWIGLLPLGEMSTPNTSATANVWLYEESNELYILTTQSIGARTPLRLGYSNKYAEEHYIPHGPPVLDLETVNQVHFWCSECNRTMATAALLQRHIDVYHKDEVKSCRSLYSCRYCRRPFGRLFTLRRHMHSNCPKRPQKSTEKSQQSSEAIPEPDISSTLEDNRIPSDESFQNFTNSLDFSTNLFDTDRIAGLDISIHSRTDGELNPYSVGFRDENELSNDLGFTKLTTDPENVQSNETNEIKKESLLDTCTYCNQVVVKETKAKHLRQCPSRLICECGRVFRHKKSLALHIHKCHPSEKPPDTDENKTEKDKEITYKCQECPLCFKRRGMLVNHLWRIHKMISTMPVEKKVRHYPCVACPKIYRSATKRNRHVRVHHPGHQDPTPREILMREKIMDSMTLRLRRNIIGADVLRGQSIEGGVKSCQPASCTACPRQYVTRAKLLQHVRAHHPHLAKAMKKQEIEMKAKTKLKTDLERPITEKYIATGKSTAD